MRGAEGGGRRTGFHTRILLESAPRNYLMDMTAKLKTVIGSPAREGQRRKAKLVIKTTAADRAKVTTYQFGSAKLTVGASAQNEWAHNIDRIHPLSSRP